MPGIAGLRGTRREIAYLAVYQNPTVTYSTMSRYDHATNRAEASRADPIAGDQVEIRPLGTPDEYRQCTELQYATWGLGYREAVPATVMRISEKMGGIAAGAFVDGGGLVGFVYGLTGLHRGRIAHWSHMLAVLPEHRDRGIGYRLKQYQRAELDRMGVEVMYWTFDPLVARNAHLNINRMQVKVLEYVPDMYSDTGSDLHVFGTDRFVVECPVRDGRKFNGAAGGEVAGAPVVDAGSVRALDTGLLDARVLRLEIPLDAESMCDGALKELSAWRMRTREQFVQLMSRGYEVTGFQRDGDRCYYIVTFPHH
jgi:predicted GNAT superfamily acetyltransferase